MKLFLIAGKAGSGKKEVAKMIKEYFIYEKQECVITGFSKYLKLYASEIIGWDGNDSNKPREFLQTIGMYVRKNLGKPNFLIDRMLDDLKVYEHYADIVVIDDIRFPEEIEAFKEKYDDVTSILVINQFGNSNLTIEQQVHPTETALENYDGFNYTLVNVELKELKDQVFKILGDLK